MTTSEILHSPQAKQSYWRTIGKLLIHSWLVFHLFCIIVAPSSVYPSSRLQQSGWEWGQYYLECLYLNHGWHFFAPDPGPSHLLTFEWTDSSGQTSELTWPNRDIQPRLLYHRHLMLTEFVGTSGELVREPWVEAFARAVAAEQQATEMRVWLTIHDLPTAQRVRAGGSVHEAELDRREELLYLTAEDLQNPVPEESHD